MGERSKTIDAERKAQAKRDEELRRSGITLLKESAPDTLKDPNVVGQLTRMGVLPEEIQGQQLVGGLNQLGNMGVVQQLMNPKPAAAAPGQTGTTLQSEGQQPAAFNTAMATAPLPSSDVAPTPQAPPTPAAPTAAPLSVPAYRPSATVSTQVRPGVSVSVPVPGTDPKESLKGVIAQAEQGSVSPNDLMRTITKDNLTRSQAGVPTLDVNDPDVKGYADRYFDRTRGKIYQDLTAQGMAQDMAFTQSAKMAFTQLGYVPQQWMEVVKPSQAQLDSGAFRNAVNNMEGLIEERLGVIKGAKPGTAYTDLIPVDFVAKAIEQTPGMRPEDVQRVKHMAANKLAESLDRTLAQREPAMNELQRHAQAMKLAGAAVGGDVPQAWNGIVQNDPKAYGYTTEQVTAYGIMDPKDRPSLFDPKAPRLLQAAVVQMENSKEYRSHLMLLSGSAETAAMTKQMIDQPAISSAPNPAPTPSQITKREMALAGEKTRQTKTIDREFSVAPTAEIEKIKPLDTMYLTGKRLQQLGPTILQKYGDYPGTIFDWVSRAGREFGQNDKELAEYVNLIAGIFNIKKKEFAGTATSLNERKDLVEYIPGAADNVRTALQNINVLMQMTGSELSRDLEYIKTNYPGTKLDSFNYNKIQDARAKQKAAKESVK